MAAKRFKSLFRGAGRNALDLPVAGLAALAAAFGAFVVPQDILSRAVIATGLPSILSAAQPPLGLTARVALAVGGALIVFGLVFVLLRLLDRSGMSAPEAEAELPVAPRLRRRDVHPDAPAPRPISAARDLGEPAPPTAPVPLWLDEAEPAGGALEAPETALIAEFSAEPVHAPEPAYAPEPEPVYAPELTAEVSYEPEPVAVPEPEPAVPPAPERVFASAPPADMPTSIAALMERLEQGLARHRMVEPAPAVHAAPPQVFPEAPEVPRQAFPAEPQPVVPETPEVFPEAPQPADAAEDRLQSAIASLQRLAARSA